MPNPLLERLPRYLDARQLERAATIELGDLAGLDHPAIIFASVAPWVAVAELATKKHTLNVATYTWSDAATAAVERMPCNLGTLVLDESQSRMKEGSELPTFAQILTPSVHAKLAILLGKKSWMLAGSANWTRPRCVEMLIVSPMAQDQATAIWADLLRVLSLPLQTRTR
jgi:hypothetical protein